MLVMLLRHSPCHRLNLDLSGLEQEPTLVSDIIRRRVGPGRLCRGAAAPTPVRNLR